MTANDLDSLPVRARAALLVWSARRCARALAAVHEAHALAERALAAAARWTRGEPVNARDLYAFIPELYDVEERVDARLLPALHAVHNAVAYVTARADREARRAHGAAAGPLLPNDIAEVTEEHVERGRDLARLACGDSEDARWRAAVERLAALDASGPESLGTAVPEDLLTNGGQIHVPPGR
jgi:hypothetical protein